SPSPGSATCSLASPRIPSIGSRNYSHITGNHSAPRSRADLSRSLSYHGRRFTSRLRLCCQWHSDRSRFARAPCVPPAAKPLAQAREPYGCSCVRESFSPCSVIREPGVSQLSWHGGRTRGWEKLKNGDLIEAAESAGFDVMVTTDKNIRHQQNLDARKLGVIVLEHSQWQMVKHVAASIAAAIRSAKPGSSIEVEVPFRE